MPNTNEVKHELCGQHWIDGRRIVVATASGAAFVAVLPAAMNEHTTLSAIDYAVLFANMALTLLLGFAVARGCAAQAAGLFSR